MLESRFAQVQGQMRALDVLARQPRDGDRSVDLQRNKRLQPVPRQSVLQQEGTEVTYTSRDTESTQDIYGKKLARA